MRKSPTLEPAGFRRESLADYLGLTASGVDKLTRRGELPKPIMLGRIPWWPKETIDKFIAEKAAA